MTGTSVSHYQVLEQLGQGGMGVVYKARDTRLGRLVALKMLPAEAVAHAERKGRFIQEAQAASALNHPHITAIYDIDAAADGSLFIAMEYVEGRTLAERIARSGLSLKETLDYAAQIAAALAAAHAAGIIHRDIKPANIMLTDQHQVKLVDFGLAKLAEPAAAAELTSTATLGKDGRALTEPGGIVGTVAYMSPEQADGRPLDARSDIFSFGAVLYEMLTGRRAFQGSSRLAVMAAVLHEQPLAAGRLGPGVPREVERIVELCLRKDPSRRWQRMEDLRTLIEELAAEVESGKAAPVGPAASRPRRRVAALIFCCGLALGALGGYLWQRLAAPKPVSQPMTMLTADVGLTVDPALSPDGKLLAYASDRAGQGNLDIWLQQLGGGDPSQLTHDASDEETPVFSPDGNKIAFYSDRPNGGGVFLMSAIGGEQHLIAPGGRGPRFSPDGTQIAYWVGDEDNLAPSARIFVLPAQGGVPRRIQPQFADARYPMWAPDGQHILFQGLLENAPNLLQAADWWVAPLDGGLAVKTGGWAVLRREGMRTFMGPGAWQGDFVFFSAIKGQSGNLWRVRIAPGSWAIKSPPEQLSAGTGMEVEPSVAAGRLVCSGIRWGNNLWRLPLEPRGAKDRLEQLTRSAAYDTHPSVSADGKLVAFLRAAGTRDLWMKDLTSGRETALTIVAGDKSPPVMTPEGTKVAYASREGTALPIYVIPVQARSAAGALERVCDDCGEPADWSRDGAQLLFLAGQPQRVAVLDVAARARRDLLVHTAYSLDQPHVSPDNRWVAFVARIRPDRTRLYVAPFRPGAATVEADWIVVSSGTAWDDKPRWALSGDALYYYSKRDRYGCIWKQRLEPSSKRPLGAPAAVQHFHLTRHSLSRVYLSRFEISVARDTLVLNLPDLTGNIWMTSLPR